MQTPFHSVLRTQGLVPISKYYHTYVNHPLNIRQTKKNEKLYTTRGISLFTLHLGDFCMKWFFPSPLKIMLGARKKKKWILCFWLHDASAETVKMICYIIMRIFPCRIVCKSGHPKSHLDGEWVKITIFSSERGKVLSTSWRASKPSHALIER